MNGQLLTKITIIEKEVKEIKSLLKGKTQKSPKEASKKLDTMKGLWKKLEITDEELEEAKKAVFDFDVEKYVGKGTR